MSTSLPLNSLGEYHPLATTRLVDNTPRPQLDLSQPIRIVRSMNAGGKPVFTVLQPGRDNLEAPIDSYIRQHTAPEITETDDLQPIDDTAKEGLYRKMSPLARAGTAFDTDWLTQRYFDDPNEGVIRLFEYKPGSRIEDGREVLGAITHDRSHLPDGLLTSYTLYIRPAIENTPQGIDMKKHSGTGDIPGWKPPRRDASEAEEIAAIMGLAAAFAKLDFAREAEEKAGRDFVSQADGIRLDDLLERSKTFDGMYPVK